MNIKTSVKNTFERVGIDYQKLLLETEPAVAINRFSGEWVKTTALLAYLVGWVYQTSNDYEAGIWKVKTSDFDRVRYFILETDPKVYSTCID